MLIKVLFFASSRDITGVSSSNVELDDSTTNTIQTLLQEIYRQYPELQAAMSNKTSRYSIALNKSYVTANEMLKDQDTVALLPPISGG